MFTDSNLPVRRYVRVGLFFRRTLQRSLRAQLGIELSNSCLKKYCRFALQLIQSLYIEISNYGLIS